MGKDKKRKDSKVYLISNGDFRDSAGVVCWPMQADTLKAVEKALGKLGVKSEVLPQYDKKRQHGFITRQCEGAEIFSSIPSDAPVVVVLSCWAYSHHVCGPLQTHKGPILLLANFDGTWPGLVALLNHAGSLARLNVPHSRLWSDHFLDDKYFMKKLEEWIKTGVATHDSAHVVNASTLKLSGKAKKLGEDLGDDIRKKRRIMGQFDPGCMGMLNAVLDPGLVGALGLPIEYLNQSDLLAEMALVNDDEAQGHLNWLIKKGVWFDWGYDTTQHLVHAQVMSQMKMYSAAGRIAERFGLAAIGIPYQLGLVRCCPASDLTEGMLNNTDRPAIVSPATGKTIFKGEPIPHFNEGDLGAGIPQLLMKEIFQAKKMPAETTLHDVRWGRQYKGKFVWVFEISGGAPPAHWNGWKNTRVFRQPPMYFPLGGGTCTGVSKPGTITWARCYQADGRLGMDCGTGEVVGMPEDEVQDRLDKTTPVWPIANVHTPGYDRNELMATHMSNHITIGYGDILQELVALSLNLGFETRVAGDAKDALA